MLTLEGKHICDRIVKQISDYNDIYIIEQINMWERVIYLLHLDIINWIELHIATVNVIYSINNEIKHDKSHWFKRLI